MTEQRQMTEQDQLGPSRDGTVMLDIGGDIGALVLHTSAEMLGVEIEISPAGDDDTHHRTHVAVRERRGDGGTRYAAIYPALQAGDYTLWRPDGRPALRVAITGGAVAEAQWS